MSKEKKRDLSAIAWLNLVLGIYNLYCFSVGYMSFNLIIGILNVGVWAFYRKPETLSLIMKNTQHHNKN